MLSRMNDKHIAALMRVAKTNKGLRPFFGNPKSMIALRVEANSRGIFNEFDEAYITLRKAFNAMEEHHRGSKSDQK